MKDILYFKDNLIAHLYKEEEANPSSLVDITDFVKSYFPNRLEISKVINDLFTHSNGSYGLITSDRDLGPNGFNQQYFNRHVVPPIKARITPSGKKYFHELAPNKNERDKETFFHSRTIPPVNKIELGNDAEIIPTVFISYSWDNKEHELWVLKLAKRLTENGVNVILDKWDLGPLGKPLPNFMETSIANSERVICVMTPNYKRKTEQLTGGVGYEYSIITSEILSNGIDTSKFIPLFRSGLATDAIPTALGGRKYVDMRDDSLFEELLNELLRDIHQEPKNKKPPIGKKPLFD